jgi:hypothetical protein
MSQAYSGIHANVLVGATDVDTSGWELKHEFNTFDSTTTADGGWDDTTTSTQKISGSITFFYNKTKYPYGLPMGPGTVATLKLFISNVDGNFFTGSGLITGLSFGAKIKEGIALTASFVNKGVWTLPTT